MSCKYMFQMTVPLISAFVNKTLQSYANCSSRASDSCLMLDHVHVIKFCIIIIIIIIIQQLGYRSL